MYAAGFFVFFVFTIGHAFIPGSSYASFSLKNAVMGGVEANPRSIAVKVAQYEAETHVRPYAHSAVSGAVYGWPSQEVSLASQVNAGDAIAQDAAIAVYEVQQGDTLLTISDQFRVSTDTIVQANGLETTEVSPGQKLIILPVSGVLHEVRTGDTLASISEYYNVPQFRISAMNGLGEGTSLSPGEKIIIPGATAQTKLAFSEATAPGVRFRMPTIGWNWGVLHRENAVDIANRCGTPVYASAAGTVTEAATSGWNNGYGTYLLVSHARAVATRYAHLSTVFVSSGASVAQGQLIGAIGKTGKVDGVSGCHLHFEILGAANPFAR